MINELLLAMHPAVRDDRIWLKNNLRSSASVEPFLESFKQSPITAETFLSFVLNFVDRGPPAGLPL